MMPTLASSATGINKKTEGLIQHSKRHQKQDTGEPSHQQENGGIDTA